MAIIKDDVIIPTVKPTVPKPRFDTESAPKTSIKPPTVTKQQTIGGNNPTIRGGMPGEIPYLSPSEPKGPTYYQPQTAETPGVAGGGANLNKGTQAPSPQSYLPPGWTGTPQSLTMADLGATERFLTEAELGHWMGLITPNMVGLFGSLAPELTPEILAQLGYIQLDNGSWMRMDYGASSGSGGGSGGWGYGGGGGSSRGRGSPNGLTMWRISIG